MKLLVVGHALIIDSNRKFWKIFSEKNHAIVDAVAPREWSSNLNKNVQFTYNPDTDSAFRKIHLIPTFFKGNGSLFFFRPWSLLNVFWKNKYDIIYVNQETWALSTLWIIILKLLSPNYKARLFLCVAQNLKKDHLKFLHPYERFVSHFIDSFLYCSEEVKEVLRWKGITTSCIYYPLPYDDQSYKSLAQTPFQTFKLGYLGRISEDKGMEVLLNTCDELYARKFPFELILGGTGPLVEEMKKKKYVTYLGLIPHNQAQHFYERIDCFILPSQTRSHWKEQFGRVIIESFGAGKPVIGSSSGSIPEVLSRLEWPWIFKEDSSKELENLILKMFDVLKTDTGQIQLAKSVKLNHKQFSQSEVALDLFQSFQKFNA